MARRSSSAIQPLEIDRFLGLDTLDPPDSVPPDHSPGPCQNVEFTSDRGIKTRRGVNSPFRLTPTAVGANSVYYQFEIYFGSTGAVITQNVVLYGVQDSVDSKYKIAYQTDNNASGILYTSANVGGAPWFFVMQPFGSFVYFFISDGQKGVDGPFVWNPMSNPMTFDLITLPQQTTGTLAAADGVAGSVTAGVHKISVMFVSRTGFISAPASGAISFNAAGSKKISLTNIPTFPAGSGHVAAECTSRWIVMSQAGLTTLYKALVIADNTSTTATVDISDAQLGQQTDVTIYTTMMSQTGTTVLPKMASGIIYNSRMCMVGPDTTQTSWDRQVLLISEAGLPQNFRADVDFLEVGQEDKFPTVTVFTKSSNLYIVKSLGLWVSQDSGGSPSTWSLSKLAEDVGTPTVRGVHTKTDDAMAYIADSKGIYIFSGTVPVVLSELIRPDASLNINNQTRLTINSLEKMLFVTRGVGTAPTNYIFVADYQLGTKNPRWSTFLQSHAAWQDVLYVGFVPSSSLTLFLNADGSINYQSSLKYDTDNVGNQPIAMTHRFCAVSAPIRQGLTYYDAFRLRAVGSGSLVIKIYDTEGTLIATPTAFTLASSPVADLERGINLTRERVFFEISQSGDVNASARVSKAVFDMAIDGERPH